MVKKRGKFAKPTEGLRKERMVTVRMHPDLHAILCQISDDTSSSLNTICINALQEYNAVRVLTLLKNEKNNN